VLGTVDMEGAFEGTRLGCSLFDGPLLIDGRRLGLEDKLGDWERDGNWLLEGRMLGACEMEGFADGDLDKVGLGDTVAGLVCA